MMDIGVKYFSSIMVDMKGGQSRLAQKYLHCEVAQHCCAPLPRMLLLAATNTDIWACLSSFVTGWPCSCIRRQCCAG